VVRALIWQRPEGKEGDKLFEDKDKVDSLESIKKLEGTEPVRRLLLKER
jgi:hypothetical protein